MTLSEQERLLRQAHHALSQVRAVEDVISARKRIAALDAIALVHEAIFKQLPREEHQALNDNAR